MIDKFPYIVPYKRYFMVNLYSVCLFLLSKDVILMLVMLKIEIFGSFTLHFDSFLEILCIRNGIYRILVNA